MSIDLESIEDSFYLFLGLHCSNCENTFYPQEESDWDKNISFNEIPDKLKDSYSVVALKKGWAGKSHENLLCPKCS